MGQPILIPGAVWSPAESVDSVGQVTRVLPASRLYPSGRLEVVLTGAAAKKETWVSGGASQSRPPFPLCLRWRPRRT